MSKEDELRDSLNDAAKNIAESESNPRAWLSWVVYLLARLEEKATTDTPTYRDSFVDMLAALQIVADTTKSAARSQVRAHSRA